MDRDVTVGVIGVGWWGRTLAARVVGLGAAIAGCYARDDDGRDQFAEEFGCRPCDDLEELLAIDGLTAVLVATPHSTHVDVIEQCAGAGKHVFVEKPLALTWSEGRRAVAAAEAAGVVLQVGHNRRRQPANRRLKQLVESGAAGALQLIETNISNAMNQTPATGWRGDPDECPAGGMTALGVHMIDTMLYLAGPARRVSAFTGQTLGHSELDDVTTVMIEFESGAIGTLATSMVVPVTTTVRVYGTTLVASNERDGEELFLQRAGELDRVGETPEPMDTVADELAEFLAATVGGPRPEVSGPEGLEVVAVLDALLTSAASGQVCELSTVRGGA